MSVPYKRYIATTSNDNPGPSIPVREWENSHNFYLESLNLSSFGMGYECPKSAIFGVKRGGGGGRFLLLPRSYMSCNTG